MNLYNSAGNKIEKYRLRKNKQKNVLWDYSLTQKKNVLSAKEGSQWKRM